METNLMSEAKESERPLQLQDLIRQVRTELTRAVCERERGNEPRMFVVEKLTLEVNFVIENEQTLDGGGKTNLLAVEFNASGEKRYKTEQVHKVTLELSPYNPEPATSKKEPATTPPSIGSFSSSGKGILKYSPEGKLILSPLHKFEEAQELPIEVEEYFKGMVWKPFKAYAGCSIEIPNFP